MNPDPQLTNHVTSAILIVYAMKWAKSQAWYQKLCAMAPGADRWFHRTVAAIGAFIAAIGVHVVFDGNATAGYTFHGTIPPLMAMVSAGWDWVQVFAMQQLAYDASRKPASMAVEQAINDRNKAEIQSDVHLVDGRV